MATPTLPLHHQHVLQRMPRWAYHAASGWARTPKHLPGHSLSNALRECEQRRRQVHMDLAAALHGLQGIVEFALPLLKAELASTFTTPLDPERDELITVQRDRLLLGALVKVRPTRQTLLEAALGNFTDGVVFAAGSALAPPGALSVQLADESTPASPRFTFRIANPYAETPADFAAMCRRLDLGARYQAHLRERFEAPATQARVRELSVAAQRLALEAAVHRARIQSEISEPIYLRLLALAQGNVRDARIDGRPMVCSRLTLDGFELADCLLFAPADQSRPFHCYVWLPGAPLYPLKEYPSKLAFYNDLKINLLNPVYRRYLAGRVAVDQRPAFLAKIQGGLYETRWDHDDRPYQHARLNAHLNLGEVALVGELFGHLVTHQWQRSTLQARALAVPTATKDDQAWRERWSEVFDDGLSVLNVAALFVPGLGEVMGCVALVQLMGQVYHGIESWEQGDYEQALAYTESVLANVAFMAVAGALAARAPTIQASPFVEGLARVPVGEGRLWQAQLKPYVHEQPLEGEPNALGQYEVRGRIYVRIEGRAYRQRWDRHTAQWRLVHPSDRGAYRPPVLHNQAGAWRLAGEDPRRWGSDTLLRRLGPVADGLSDETLAQARQSCAVPDEVLRQAYLDNRPPPALLRDTLQRCQAQRQAQALVGLLRDGRPLPAALHSEVPGLLVGLPGWPESVSLRVYTGPEPWGNSVDYRSPNALGEVRRELSITRDQLFEGRLSETVIEGLGEEGTQAVLGQDASTLTVRSAKALRQRLAEQALEHRVRIRERLYRRRTDSPDLGVALLQRDFPTLPSLAAEEILEAARAAERDDLYAFKRVPMRLAEEARLFVRENRLTRAVLGVFQPELASADTAVLVRDPSVRLSVLAEQLANDRARVASQLGMAPPRPWLKPPLRLADGRLGYPLSGRSPGGVASAHTHAYAALYPGLPLPQVEQMLLEVRALGLNPEAELVRRQAEFTQLTTQLTEWCRAVDPLEGPTTLNRQAIAQRIRQCWQRQGGHVMDLDGSLNYGAGLDLAGLALDGELPPLHGDFSHVRRLDLSDMTLSEFPQDFLAHFPRMTVLELSTNQLEALPPSIGQLTRLRRLSIEDNLLELDQNAVAGLGQLTNLESLNLGANAIELDAEGWAQLGNLTRLTSLELGWNNLQLDAQAVAHLAGLTRLELLDMGNNPLSVAPDVSALANLRVLNLDNCELTALPSGLGELHRLISVRLDHNQLVDWPEAGFLPQGEGLMVEVSVTDNPFSEAALQRIAVSEQYSRAVINTLSREHTYLDELYQDMPAADVLRYRQLAQQPGSQRFIATLETLYKTDDYERQPENLRTRVVKMLEAALANTQLREKLFEVARLPENCGDQVSLFFSRLEISLQVYEIDTTAVSDADRSARLIAFFTGTWRLDAIDRIAERDIAERVTAGRGVDDVEIILAYRIRSAQALGLPNQPATMLHVEVAAVSDEQVQAAVAEVLAAETPEGRVDWAVRQDYWQDYLKQRYAERFEQRLAPFHDQLEAALNLADETRIGTEVQRIEAERDFAEKALMREMTVAQMA